MLYRVRDPSPVLYRVRDPPHWYSIGLGPLTEALYRVRDPSLMLSIGQPDKLLVLVLVRFPGVTTYRINLSIEMGFIRMIAGCGQLIQR